MNLNARVDFYYGRTDGWTYEQTTVLTDGQKTGRLYRILLKQVRQKGKKNNILFTKRGALFRA